MGGLVFVLSPMAYATTGDENGAGQSVISTRPRNRCPGQAPNGEPPRGARVVTSIRRANVMCHEGSRDLAGFREAHCGGGYLRCETMEFHNDN